MSKTHEQRGHPGPPAEVLHSGDSLIWTDAFIAAARKQPDRLLDHDMIEMWMGAALSTGYAIAKRAYSTAS